MSVKPRKPEQPILSGDLDAFRGALSYCRLSNQPITYILTTPTDLPTASQIAQDAAITLKATLTLLLTPDPVKDFVEPMDEFFDDNGDELTPELAAPLIITYRKPRAKYKPRKLRQADIDATLDAVNDRASGKLTEDEIEAKKQAKRTYMKNYMKKYNAAKKAGTAVAK